MENIYDHEVKPSIFRAQSLEEKKGRRKVETGSPGCSSLLLFVSYMCVYIYIWLFVFCCLLVVLSFCCIVVLLFCLGCLGSNNQRKNNTKKQQDPFYSLFLFVGLVLSVLFVVLLLLLLLFLFGIH